MKNIVSIIIPCYNQSEYLTEAVVSVLSQTHTHWECIIVNDGSTDDTKNIALEFCKNDPRISYIEQHNQGLSAARNAGIKVAKGDYIQFLDSDDILVKNKLSIQVQQLQQQNTHNPSISICSYHFCDNNNIAKKVNEDFKIDTTFDKENSLQDIILRWEEDLSIPVHCFLFDTRIFNENKIYFDTKQKNHEDWLCWTRIFALNINVYFSPETLALYRVNSDSMSRDTTAMYIGFLKAIKLARKNFKSQPELLSILKQKHIQVRQKYMLEKEYNRFLTRKNSKTIRTYKRLIPWPLQRLITSLSTRLKGN